MDAERASESFVRSAQAIRSSRSRSAGDSRASAAPIRGPSRWAVSRSSLRWSPHAAGSLAFDLLAVGDWTTDTDVEKITVMTDRAAPQVITPADLTPGTVNIPSLPQTGSYKVVVDPDKAKTGSVTVKLTG